jgi:hypothetical protein
MGYITPADVGVSDNRAAHVARGSAEPGTDYMTAYGTDLRAPGWGRVIGVDRSPDGPEGRRLTFLMDNGEVIDWIHLSQIMTNVNEPIAPGLKGLALSGGSGWGRDRYYDPHVHVTRRARIGLPYRQTLDFEDAIDRGGAPASAGPSASTPNATPILSEEDDMPINFRNPANGGITYTMVPGFSITAHINAFGSRLTNFVNTGVWPASESDQDRFNAGLRNLNSDHVSWMLGFYGFGRFNADTLPRTGTVYSDVIQSLMDSMGVAVAEAKATHGDTARIIDSITPGESGVKYDGQLWAHISQQG